MMKIDDFDDNEIRPIGYTDNADTSDTTSRKTFLKRVLWVAVVAVVVLVVVPVCVLFVTWSSNKESAEPMVVGIEVNQAEPASELVVDTVAIDRRSVRIVNVKGLSPSLHVGPLDTTDVSIRIALQAADFRADNGAIVGDFVLKGQLLSQGCPKQGYCEITDNQLSIGSSEDSGCKQCAIDQEGYFFRQYLLVNNGQPQQLKPKGKHLRRALCMTEQGELLLAFSNEELTFGEFAEILARIPVSQAIYLTGGSAYGFMRGLDGTISHFGYPVQLYDKENVNYLVFR